MAVIEEKKTEKREAVKKTAAKPVENAEMAYKVLAGPWITEKSHAAMAHNKYAFKVSRRATKKQVKTAIEGFYGVKVEDVNVINLRPKKKAYGRHEGKKQGIRKAIVTLKEGNSIELFKGA